MRTRNLIITGVSALGALCLCLGLREARRNGDGALGPAGALLAPPPAEMATRVKARNARAAPAPNAEEALGAYSSNTPRKVGVALAVSYRDDICRCETKACRHEASAAYKHSVGLVTPRSAEDAALIEDAMRAVIACIQRIDAAEAEKRDADSPG